MKTRIIVTLIALLVWPMMSLKAQPQPEQLNLPGDNLNLYAVMKMFQESETLELFENKLNEEDTRVNNLDLNGDNYIDYIRVIDYVEKSVHYIVLQVAVTPTENQDVAVFVVKKDPEGKVIIQLIGDEALYGKYYIVEPYYDTEDGTTPNPGYYGNYSKPKNVTVHHTTYYEVASWPIVHIIFLPDYIAWHSPWYWGYYPTYWHPWAPWFWHEYYGYHYHWHDYYFGHYHHWKHHRFDGWNDNYYGPRRTASATVNTRINRGEYQSSYSKPESIRDGSEKFKKDHPDKVTKDMKEPEVKNIMTADKVNKEYMKANDSKDNAIKTDQKSEKKWAKPQSHDNKAVKKEAVSSGKKNEKKETDKSPSVKVKTKSAEKSEPKKSDNQKKTESKKTDTKSSKDAGRTERK